MKTITLVLCACLLVACSACDETGRETAKPERFTVTWLPDGTYRLGIRFDGVAGYDGLVDEKRIDATATHGEVRSIVEYFRPSGGWHLDEHQFPQSFHPGLIIEGKVYPVDVSGMNLDEKGYGVLPQNSDGSAITSPDIHLWVLSPEWFAAHPIGGQVTATGGPAILYREASLSDNPATPEVDPGLLLTWDGVDHWFPKP